MKLSAATNAFLLAGILNCSLAWSTCGAELVETNATAMGTNAPGGEVKPEESISAEEVLRAYLQVQNQLHEAKLAIEQARQESQQARQESLAAAARNAEAWSNRLEFVEQTLTAQRDREFETMQKANNTVLAAVGTFAGIGFLAMIFTSWLQWRAAHRFSEMAASSQMTRTLLPPGWTMPVLTGPEGRPTGEPVTPSGRLLDAIGHLEKLVLSLERTATPPLGDDATAPKQQQQASSPAQNIASTPGDGAPSDAAARITLLLGKGQSLLNLDQPEKAEACFTEVLGLDANNTEALLKKGVALERQRKLNEAIEFYDRAIASDSSMTIAYLYKGGIYNRMERFSEALECYEKALHTQEKRRAS